MIGGGNTAVEEALYLTNHSPDVTLIHRRDSLRSEKILQERLFANDKISVMWNKEVLRFAGDPLAGGLTHLELRDTVTGAASQLPVDGAFVAIGHAPATELFKGKLEMDESGYLVVEPSIVRRSQPRAPAAWPHWTPNGSSPRASSLGRMRSRSPVDGGEKVSGAD